MRFTSVGPKWRAALQSSLSSLALAPFAFLPSRMPSPPSCSPTATVRLSVRSLVRLTISLLLSLSRGPAARHRLQECTKCTALTDTRSRSTASTCLLRPFASLPVSPPFSLLVFLSRSFVSFFSGRLLRLRGLSHPLHRSAAAAAAATAVATPGYGPLLYHRCGSVVARLFSSTPSRYIRPNTHARTHARIRVRTDT